MLGFVLATAGLSGLAFAQVAPPLLQPRSFQPIGYESSQYLDTGAPAVASTGPAAADAAATAPALPAPPDSDPGAMANCPPDAAGPWKLPQPCLFQRLGINVGGWVQQGITFNADRPADRFNGPVMTNDRDREYQLNQAWIYMVRPTKTDGCGWDLGGRADVVYGTDWRFGQNVGLEDQIDGNNNFYGLILPQFYAEVAVNNLTVKMGHFATGTSYELVPAVANFFYSHNYLMAGYFDPLLVTGMLADYKVNDNLSVVSGFHRGWMMFEDNNDQLNYLGGLRWASDDKRTTLAATVDTGAEDPAGLRQRTSCIVVFTRQFNDKLLYAAQFTDGFENNGSFVTPGQDAEWYGLSQWLTYKLNSKWSAGARYEWVRDDDGARIAGIGNLLGTDRGWRGLPGFAGNFSDLSLGLNWRPNANLVLRPEIRWDWYDGPRNPSRQLPFDDFSDRNQFTTAMDMIVTF